MITLDIAGFYYGCSVPADGIVTVLGLMNKAKNVRTSNDGVLNFDLENNQYINRLSVTYDGVRNPESRQKGGLGLPKARPKGTYEFTDDVFSPSNRIIVPGKVSGLHAWQYYITDVDGRLKSRGKEELTRGIVSAAESDQEPFGKPLVDGDTVVWRLIAIFGLNDILDSQRSMLLAKSGGRSLGLKAAMEIMSAENVDFSNLIQ